MKSKSPRIDELVAGAKVFKVKRRTATKVAACAGQLVARRVGYGTILIGGESAVETVALLGAKIRRLLERNPSDHQTLLALWRLQIRFIRLVLDSGKVLIGE